MTLLALTRELSDSIGRCELTHVEREGIDAQRARQQHAAYEAALTAAGCRVQRLEPLPHHPDAVFVEDTVVVFEEFAVLTRPGAASRRGEVGSVERAIERHRAVQRIHAPATLDGGDVLVVGRRIYVGCTSRTNAAGIEQLDALARPFGMDVRAVRVDGCLHLKTAVTRFDGERLVLNPRWVDPADFAGHQWLATDPSEPFGANVLAVGAMVLVPAHHPGTVARLRTAGAQVVEVDYDELARAEGGVTCCSVILEVEPD